MTSWIVLTAMLGALAPRLASVQDNRTVNDPPASSDSVTARALRARAFPDERGTRAVVILRDSRGLGPAGWREVRRITDALSGPARPPGVGRVVSALDAPRGPQARLSADGTTAQIVVAVLGSSSEDAFANSVDAVRRVAGTGRNGLEVRVTGPAAIARDTVKAFGQASLVLVAGTVGLVLILLLVIYRSPLLALLPLLAVGLAMRSPTRSGPRWCRPERSRSARRAHRS